MIFINQSNLTLQLDTQIDLSTATSVAIIFKKPSGATGQWTGTVNGTKIEYLFTGSEIDATGIWELQAKMVTATGTSLGQITKQRVINSL